MHFSERPLNRRARGLPLYIQIAESLLDQIESGELSPGDRLPAERKLSDTAAVCTDCHGHHRIEKPAEEEGG